ncbi:hypothetical protein HX99_07185 [Peptococcaceae bacterium SCADC1_2_3]|nr:hypothetical protein DK28_0212540 [Peptococcaceae bacterium SCADC1_2_3]KFI36865.1 hypothetical protein HX99_07185 [Peptococcaceae bacterium SCADC1_2_3]KFI37473.1 hypothetical protein HY02_06400 [Peptococcaceae bacterium SCADC1_2_3]
MTWRLYQVVFRLRSSLHIGCGKVGNLQRTRPYVTGRVLWGALTMRLTRDQASGRGPAINSRDYQRVGQQVHQSLAFTYFYPATKSGEDYRVDWFWDDEHSFGQRFLSSYSGTALSYPYQSALTGMLHEVEFISPTTLDNGEPVFLLGYIFERDDNKLAWQDACKRLQVGGERGYGWGAIELVEACESKDRQLFDGKAVFNVENDLPVIRLPASEQTPGRLLAHTLTTNLPAAGKLEPLVGREWRSDASRHRYAGQYVAFNDVCFTPGSTVSKELDFSVGVFGVWRMV